MVMQSLITLHKGDRNSEYTLLGYRDSKYMHITITYDIFREKDICDTLDFFCFDIEDSVGFFDLVTVVYYDEEKVSLLLSRKRFVRGEFV